MAAKAVGNSKMTLHEVFLVLICYVGIIGNQQNQVGAFEYSYSMIRRICHITYVLATMKIWESVMIEINFKICLWLI